MPFDEEFTQKAEALGVSVSSPDQQSVYAQINELSELYNSLDDTNREVLDELAADSNLQLGAALTESGAVSSDNQFVASVDTLGFGQAVNSLWASYTEASEAAESGGTQTA
jgi:hypothetical protein